LCVYAQGPNLLQVFGLPYSAPAFFKLLLEMDAPVETRSDRLPGAAIWTHQVALDGQAIGEITDLVDAELPCLVRRLQLTAPLHFRLAVEEPVKIVENGAAWRAALAPCCSKCPPANTSITFTRSRLSFTTRLPGAAR